MADRNRAAPEDGRERQGGMTMAPLVHFWIDVDGETLWDGRTPSPPAVGDLIRVDLDAPGADVTVRVLRRVWRSAEEVMGPEAAASWGLGATDQACVALECERVDNPK